MNDFGYLWLYIVGPLAGGGIAGLLYEKFLCAAGEATGTPPQWFQRMKRLIVKLTRSANPMNGHLVNRRSLFLSMSAAVLLCGRVLTLGAADDPGPQTLGEAPRGEELAAMGKGVQGEKRKSAERQDKRLAERYELSDKPAEGGKMGRGKPVQGGVRVKLPKGATWEKLASMTPDDIKKQSLWPAGFYPLP